MLDQAFADIGLAFSQAFGGIFWPAQIITNTPAEYDDGGSIIVPGGVVTFTCQTPMSSPSISPLCVKIASVALASMAYRITLRMA